MPLKEVTVKDGTLTINIEAANATYTGKLSADGAAVTGAWKQGSISLALNLARTKDAPTVRRPQEPKKPYPYNEEEVSYAGSGAGVTLAGTLTLPRGKGPFPAALLITGSGPEDRDEAVFGHRPFLVLADFLTRQGIAVLRVDDRGVGKSTGDLEDVTSEMMADDVLAGVAYLRTRKEIGKIGLIGHSEGGLIAAITAARAKDASFDAADCPAPAHTPLTGTTTDTKTVTEPKTP